MRSSRNVSSRRSPERADATSVADTNLFPDEAGFTPRPAWQVIEAARRQYLTGELTLPTTPATRDLLARWPGLLRRATSDGALPIRLMMEGVITREQMQRGTVIVNGVEHVGRMFDADPTIDRASVELCAELFTDDVMVAVANASSTATSWRCIVAIPAASTVGTRTASRSPRLTESSRQPETTVPPKRPWTRSESITTRSRDQSPRRRPRARKPAQPEPEAETRAAQPEPRQKRRAVKQPEPTSRRRAREAAGADGRSAEPVQPEPRRAAEQPQCTADHPGGARSRAVGTVAAPPPPIRRKPCRSLRRSPTRCPRDPGRPDRADPGDRSAHVERGRCGVDRRRSGRGDQASVRRHRRRKFEPLAAGAGEEVAQQLACFSACSAGHDRRAMVEPWIAAHLVQADDRAGLRVGGAEHHPADAGVDERAGTHHARLERDVQRAVEQPPVADDAARRRGSPAPRRARSDRRSARARCAGRRSPRRRAPRPRRSARRRGRRAAAAWSSASRIASSSVSGAVTAEGVGFEPTEGCPSHAFQACRFGRSRTPPGAAQG